MFYLNMVDYTVFFPVLSTLTWDTLLTIRDTWGLLSTWVAHKILASAPVPLELIWAFGPGFDWAGPRGLGRRVWDLA